MLTPYFLPRYEPEAKAVRLKQVDRSAERLKWEGTRDLQCHSGGNSWTCLPPAPLASPTRLHLRRGNGRYLFTCAQFSVHLPAPSLNVGAHVLQSEAGAAVATEVSNRLKTNTKRAFDAQVFLDSAGVARKVVEFKPKFHKIPEIILLIRGGIAQDSLSGYWERSDQFIGLGLHRRRLRHLPEGYTRLLRLP